MTDKLFQGSPGWCADDLQETVLFFFGHKSARCGRCLGLAQRILIKYMGSGKVPRQGLVID